MVTSFSDWEGTCLMHHGIKGQKWGVRRYQNPDGTLTPAGKKHEQKATYKSMKALGKEYAKQRRHNDFITEARKFVPKEKLKELAKMKKKAEIAYLSGKRKYDEAHDQPEDIAREKVINDILGKYAKKKIAGRSAGNELTRAIHRATDEMAYGNNYEDWEKWVRKYSKNKMTIG